MKEIVIKIPDNATNGDMIKALFPKASFKYPQSIFETQVKGYIALDFPVKFHRDWWDAPYKENEHDKEV